MDKKELIKKIKALEKEKEENFSWGIRKDIQKEIDNLINENE